MTVPANQPERLRVAHLNPRAPTPFSLTPDAHRCAAIAAELVDELVASGTVAAELAARHRTLTIAGLVGSIDNDLVGVDSTIGADTALHRILEALDAISSTAASHQRSFVLEVMGRHCGYLALAAAIARYPVMRASVHPREGGTG